MTKTFILKNRENKELGEISYSEHGFRVDISPVKEKEEIEGLLNEFLKEGIRNLGEVILKDPIMPGDPLFLGEVQNQLARRGYIMLEKKK